MILHAKVSGVQGACSQEETAGQPAARRPLDKGILSERDVTEAFESMADFVTSPIGVDAGRDERLRQTWLRVDR